MQRPQDDLLERRASLTRQVDDALERLAAGVLPEVIEHEAIDFKEEAGRRGRGGVLLAPLPQNLAAADGLADEVACLSNSPGGGALVVGVEDTTGALLGTLLDVEWLRHRIWERVDIAPLVQARLVSGVRLLVLLVAEAREPVEDTAGRIRWRIGGHCTPVDRAEWWLHRQATGSYDPLAVASSRSVRDVAAAAIAQTRRLLADADQLDAADSDADLLSRLGAVRPGGVLTQAAALVFCPSPPAVTVSVLDVEGGDIVVPAPDLAGRSLLEQLTVVEDRLAAVNTAVTLRAGFTETPVRALPPSAVREVICNALVHRDWLPSDPVEITWVQLDASLTVVSPGGFVGGVGADNALTNRYARSPALADLFRALHLVEKQGLGVDRMVRELVSVGHRPVRLEQRAGPRIRARMTGGQPVVPVLALVRRVEPAVRRRDVRVALIVHTLFSEPYVTPSLLGPVLQRGPEEISDALLSAADCRVDGQPLIVAYKDVWQFSEAALDVVRAADAAQPTLARRGLLSYVSPTSSLGLVRRWLRDHRSVTSGDIAHLSGLTMNGGRGQLERLVGEGILQRGAERGRNAHFVAGPAFQPAPVPPPLLSDPSGTVHPRSPDDVQSDDDLWGLPSDDRRDA